MSHSRENEVVGHYRVIRALGKGGDGSVWLAVHLQTEHLWALKEIPRSDGRREFREASVMKKLRHPSLAGVFEVLETPESIILVMAYIYGRNLDQIRQSCGRLRPEQVLDTGLQVCGALIYLHGRKEKILHLDIKPANLILQSEGRVVLVDFGAAKKEKLPERERHLTDDFAPPELYDLQHAPDEKADIYELGATMYLLISGVRYEAFMRKSRVPGCPEQLDRVIRRCLATQPEERYQSAAELYKALLRVKRRLGREQLRIRLWALLLLLLFAGYGAGTGLREAFRSRVRTEWTYEELLEEAARSGDENRLQLCRQAVFLAPERKEGYQFFLNEMENDGRLLGEEDEAFRNLLHTIPPGRQVTYEEMLAEDPQSYGPVAFRAGLLYWYGFEHSKAEGRRIAAGWFERAVKAAEELTAVDAGNQETSMAIPGNGTEAEGAERGETAAEVVDTEMDETASETDGGEDSEGWPDVQISGEEDWKTAALVYARMAGYFERMELPYGQGGESAFLYWEDLQRLWNMNREELFDEWQEMSFLLESMDRMVMTGPALIEEGITDGEIASMGKQIRRKSTDLNEMKKENAWFSGMNDEIQERYGQLELLIESIKTSGN